MSSKNNDVNKMVVPAVLPKPKNYRVAVDDEEEGPSSGGGGPGGRGVTFKLLSRDAKGRFETRQLLVPEDNKMAVKLAKSEEAMRIEKQRLKERVLQIDQLTAEAEVSDLNHYHSHIVEIVHFYFPIVCHSSRLPRSALNICGRGQRA